ncbi:hypothetical protein G7085_02105 [Tessaracoccus sp. HDW20]|uniref:hypothetical protein n=1 Tax=Tessaracoccus coleopterorum TaxID=2714950 RepID=UPI0018D2E427|nr:hypothetical protein [Tessaracoccus coleopterorum]NHB83874.1 hypothetical protein [Tessaracoccus coleopterorum]
MDDEFRSPLFHRSSTRPRHVWGRLLVLLVPVGVLGVSLKLQRIGQFFPAAGPGEVAVKVASDVAFGGAWVLLWLLACWLTKGTARTVAFYVAHVLTLVLGIFTVISHEYVKRTGQPLTLAQIAYAWRQQGELNALLQSQLTNSTILLLVFVVLGATVFPPLFGPLVSRLIRRRPKAGLKYAGAAVLVALLVSSVWSAPTVSAAFALAAPVQLAVTPVREAMAYPASLADEEPLATPETTTLVPRGARPATWCSSRWSPSGQPRRCRRRGSR